MSKPSKSGCVRRANDLAHAVRAVVEADERIAVAHRRDRRAVLDDHRRRDELVGLVSLVRDANDLERIRSLGSGAEHRDAIPLLGAIPALVAVHAEVPSAEAGDDGATRGVVDQLAHVAERRSRHRVASVEQRVDGDARHAAFGAQIDQREEVLVDRVHAAVADQTHQVNGPVVLDRGVARANEHGILEERPVANRFADANEVLHHDASGAEVQVSDLAVAHLPLRQPDGEPGRIEQRAGIARDERVPRGSVGQRDRISFAFWAVSPAVEHYQDHRTFRHDPRFEMGIVGGSGQKSIHSRPAPSPGPMQNALTPVAKGVCDSSFLKHGTPRPAAACPASPFAPADADAGNPSSTRAGSRRHPRPVPVWRSWDRRDRDLAAPLSDVGLLVNASLRGSSGKLFARFITADPHAQGAALFRRLFGVDALTRPGVYPVQRAGLDRPFAFVALRPFADKQGSQLGPYRIGYWPGERGVVQSWEYENPVGFIEVTPRESGLCRCRSIFVSAIFSRTTSANVWPKYLVLRESLVDKLELVISELERSGIQVQHMAVMSGFRTPQYNATGGNTDRAR